VRDEAQVHKATYIGNWKRKRNPGAGRWNPRAARIPALFLSVAWSPSVRDATGKEERLAKGGKATHPTPGPGASSIESMPPDRLTDSRIRANYLARRRACPSISIRVRSLPSHPSMLHPDSTTRGPPLLCPRSHVYAC
jgi:hypothetical protein